MSDEIHICTGTNPRYLVYLRETGARTWKRAGKATGYDTRDTALRVMVREYTRGRWKRGMVALVADYYEPLPVFELVQR